MPGERSEALRTARERRMAEWFGERRWRLAVELTFENENMEAERGEFWIRDGKVFRTPFGNKGTHGYILQEVNPDTGNDIYDDKKHAPSRVSFGWVTIKNAADMYPGCILVPSEDGSEWVAGIPPRPYGKERKSE